MFGKVGFTELLFTSENGMGLRNGHIPGGMLIIPILVKTHTLCYVNNTNISEVGFGALLFTSENAMHCIRTPGVCHLYLTLLYAVPGE